MSKKLLWSRNGAVIGLVIFLADYFLEWRGAKYLPWNGSEAIANNIGQMIGVIGGAALIGFVAGAVTDARARKAN